jgi:predicted nucleotidyltransferase
MTQLGLLAVDLGVHERTLRRAVSEGVLHAVRPTARTLALPLSERRYVRRKWPLLSSLRQALRTEQNVRFAVLFGSAATGSDTPGSDIDVLVDLRDSSLDRIVDLSSKLTRIVGRRVDVVRLQDAEADPAFLLNVLADGRVLVDREKRWARLQRREPSRAPRRQLQHAMRARAALGGIDRLLGA